MKTRWQILLLVGMLGGAFAAAWFGPISWMADYEPKEKCQWEE